MILLKSFVEYFDYVFKVHSTRGFRRFQQRLVPNFWIFMIRIWIVSNLFLMYCLWTGQYEAEVEYYFPASYNMFFRWSNRSMLFLISTTFMAFYAEGAIKYMLDQTPVLLHIHFGDFVNAMKYNKLSIRQGLLLDYDLIRMPSFPYLKGYSKELTLFIMKGIDLGSLAYVYVIVAAFLLAPLIHVDQFILTYRSFPYLIWELVTAYFWWFQVMNGLRQTLYLGCGHGVIAACTMVPLRQFYKTLRRKFRSCSPHQLKLIMNYYQHMYIFHFLEFEYMDKHGIRAFFMKVCIYVMMFCMINTAALITATYSWSLTISVVILTAFATGAVSFAVFFLIYEANSLTLPALQLANVLDMKQTRDQARGQPLYRSVKLGYFFELLHSKKCFRFNLGSFGRISSKAWLGFLLFYSSWVFTLMSDYF